MYNASVMEIWSDKKSIKHQIMVELIWYGISE